MDMGGLSLLPSRKDSLARRRGFHYTSQGNTFGGRGIEYTFILDIIVWDNDGIRTKLSIWASPETTQAAQTAACDLLLQGLNTYKTTSRVNLSY
jgi:hypothetical protein